MKWLWIAPFWVFFICYFVIKLGKKGEESQGETYSELILPSKVVSKGALPEQIVVDEKTVVLPRKERVEDIQIRSMSDQLRKRVEILPVTGKADIWSPLWPMGRSNIPKEKQYSSGSSGHWTLFESEELSFYIPEIKHLRVEVVEESLIIPMLGSIYHVSAESKCRWYRVALDSGMTWAAIAVDDADHFDDRNRYPVSEKFHRTLAHGGGVARFCLDDHGRICRVQWLGNGRRVSLLSSQHCGARLDDYSILAASLELGNALRVPLTGMQRVIRASTRTVSSRIGLLEPGMRSSDVIDLLGNPVGVSGSTFLYHSVYGNADCYFRIPFGEDGVYYGLGNGWREIRKDPPLRGSIEWMEEKTEVRAGRPGGIGYDIGSLSDGDAHLIINQLMLKIPAAEEIQLTRICRVLENLAELDLQDKRLINLLRARFLEDEVSIRPVISVLWRWNKEGSKSIFMQKARDIISAFRWQLADKVMVSQTADDLRVLLDFIGQEHSETAEIIALMANHGNATLRETGFSLLGWLQGDQLRTLALSGAVDMSDRVRLYCAEVLASGVAESSDENFLREWLSKEQNALIREKLTSAVASLIKP